MPHVYTGSMVIKQPNSNGYAILWTVGQFQQQFGRPWGNDVCVAAMNGDWDVNPTNVLGVRYTQSGQRIDVMLDRKTATTSVLTGWSCGNDPPMRSTGS